MGRVLLGTGEYAKIPYCFDNLDIRVFSAEELCYVLKENAFLLDREILNRKLVKWIDEVLKLPELAASLYPLLHHKGTVDAFVGIIQRYVRFYDEETIRRTEELYRKSVGLNLFEKQKTRVDYMAAGGRYASAVSEYDALAEQLPEEEKILRAKVLHNKGVALCGLFLFEEAAEQFKSAYDIQAKEESLFGYLAAMRLSMAEEDYIAFAAGHPEYYDMTLELERRVDELRIQWEDAPEKQRLDERISRKEEGYMTEYYTETDKRIQELKNRYRENVGK